jgi:hypothetical protein
LISTTGAWYALLGSYFMGSQPVGYSKSSAISDAWQWRFIVPDGLTRVDAHMTGFASPSGSNAMTWTASLGCIANGAARGSGTYNAGSAATVSTTVDGPSLMFTMNSLDLTGCVAGNVAYVNVARSGTFTGDYWMDLAEVDLWY